MTPEAMLVVAVEEALLGLKQGGIPIGAALFDAHGKLLGRGHNRRIQDNDPSVHGETDAFRNAGRQTDYSRCTMVTTLSPCWYCSGLIRQFKIGRVIIGESKNFAGHIEWLRDAGVDVLCLQDTTCIKMMRDFIIANPEAWNEDIGVVEESECALVE